MYYGNVCIYCDYHILSVNKGNQYKCNKCEKRSKYFKYRVLKEDEYFVLKENMSLKDKHNLFNFLFTVNKMKIFNIKIEDINIDKVFNKFKVFNEYKKIKLEDLILFLVERNNICFNKNCKEKTSFERIGKIDPKNSKDYSHTIFCSKKCLHENRSIEMTEDNPVYKIKNVEEWKKNLSIGTLKSIENGTFTPNITNSWTNFKTKIKGKSYRSTWEAFFHVSNKHLEYEKIRLPYKYKGKKHVYIVDFVDRKTKILYEIKPDSEKRKDLNIIKENTAIEWCTVNGYTYKIISNDWFHKNYPKNKHLLKDYPEIQEKLKQFE